MELTEAQYERIAPFLPVQRGNVRLPNLLVLNAILYVAEHGCKWRGLPERFGNWHTVYMRMNRWSKNGVLDRVFTQLQLERILHIKLEAVSLDSTIVKAHPDGTGAPKKRGPKPSDAPALAGAPKLVWVPRMTGRSKGPRSPPGRPVTRPKDASSFSSWGRSRACSCSWIAPMRAMPHAGWGGNWAMCWWCRLRPGGGVPGRTTANATAVATRLSASSGG